MLRAKEWSRGARGDMQRDTELEPTPIGGNTDESQVRSEAEKCVGSSRSFYHQKIRPSLSLRILKFSQLRIRRNSSLVGKVNIPTPNLELRSHKFSSARSSGLLGSLAVESQVSIASVYISVGCSTPRSSLFILKVTTWTSNQLR